MSRWYRTVEQIRRHAWEAYETAEHERLEIRRLLEQRYRERGRSRLTLVEFMEEDVIKEAVGELRDAMAFVTMHTEMFQMELDWQREVADKLESGGRKVSGTGD
jgi:hypothetical protein